MSFFRSFIILALKNYCYIFILTTLIFIFSCFLHFILCSNDYSLLMFKQSSNYTQTMFVFLWVRYICLFFPLNLLFLPFTLLVTSVVSIFESFDELSCVAAHSERTKKHIKVHDMCFLAGMYHQCGTMDKNIVHTKLKH